MRLFRSLLLAAAVAGAPAASLLSETDAHASVSIAVAFDVLVKDAEAVGVVTPIEQKSVWEEGRIYTYTRLKMEQGVAGELGSGAESWVRTMGGVVGNIGQLVDGEAVFTTGKSSLVFLRKFKATGTWEVSARAQGQYPVVLGDGASPAAPASVRKVIRSSAVGVLLPPKATVQMAADQASLAAPAAGDVRPNTASVTADPVKVRLAGEVLHDRPLDDVAREIAVSWKRLHPAPIPSFIPRQQEVSVRDRGLYGTRTRLLAMVAGAAVVVAPGVASAFCRTTTMPVVADFQPSPTKCWDQGVPLFWRNSCVGYSVQKEASRQVSVEDATNGISRAFSKWTGSACPTDGTKRSRVSIDVRDLGSVECGDVKYNQNGANQNVIVFRDGKWPHADNSNTLALTTVTFDPKTGEIFDADMEINTFDQRVTLTDPVPKEGYDFASIVTHEAGHFLGLAHSGDNRATMFANYTPGTTALRNLTSDDVAGVCSIYLPDGTRTVLDDKITTVTAACDPTPRRGYTGQCAEPPPKTCNGSSQVAAGSPLLSHGWLALVGLGAALGLRRVHRARRR